MEKQSLERLIPLLEKASDFFESRGHTDIWDSQHYSDELGLFCRQMSIRLAQGDIPNEDKRKLWLIFAPTCEWDDAGGDAHLGSQIFEIIHADWGDIVTKS